MAILLRALVSWLLTLGWAFVVLLGALCLGFGNFVVCWQSFVAQGYEQVPLRNVPLLGPLAEGLGLGDAPLASLYALVLTLAMNLAVMATAKVLARALRLFFDRRQALRSEDPAERATAPDYLDRVIREVVFLAILAVTSVLIIQWDVKSFSFRYEGLFTDLSDPGEALGWAPEAVARLGEFLASFIRAATWGYVGCVIAMAVALEYAIVRVAEHWHVLHNAFAQAVAPEAHAATAAAQDTTRAGQAPPAVQSDTVMETPAAEQVSISPMPTQAPATVAADPEPISPPPAAEPPPAPAPRGDGPTVDVVVGPGRMESFPLAEVQTDAERFVRDGSGRAWFLRDYWEQLMGDDGHPGVTP